MRTGGLRSHGTTDLRSHGTKELRNYGMAESRNNNFLMVSTICIQMGRLRFNLSWHLIIIPDFCFMKRWV
jgi:hypothetical protein